MIPDSTSDTVGMYDPFDGTYLGVLIDGTGMYLMPGLCDMHVHLVFRDVDPAHLVPDAHHRIEIALRVIGTGSHGVLLGSSGFYGRAARDEPR